MSSSPSSAAIGVTICSNTPPFPSTNVSPSSASQVMSANTIDATSAAPASTTVPHRGISDLPTELLLIIVGHLWPQDHHANWYDQYDRHGYYVAMWERRMRMDALAFVSCSKDLRRRIFHEWVLNEVTVRLDEEELSKLAALSEVARHSVRRLIIVPARQSKDAAKQEPTVGFVDFVERFSGLDTLSVWWPLHREGARDFARLPTCEKITMDQHDCPTSDDMPRRIPSTLDIIRVRAKFDDWSDAAPEEMITSDQLGCLVRHLEFIPARTLCISIGAGTLLGAMDRERCLSAIVAACNEHRLSGVTEASLSVDMYLDGKTRDIKVVDMFRLLSLSCWIKNSLNRMDIRLLFHWREGDRWDEIQSVWDEPLLKHGPVIPCPATPPSSLQLIDLATTIQTIRPHLKEFSASAKCFIRTESYQKPLGPAQWELTYPAGTLTRHPLDRGALPDDEKLVRITSVPIGEERAVTFLGYDGHCDSACCAVIREREDDSVGESAWKARMEEEEMGIGYHDEMLDMEGSSDRDSDSEEY